MLYPCKLVMEQPCPVFPYATNHSDLPYISWKNIRVWRDVYPSKDAEFIRQKGSNCKPRKTFKRLESIHSIKRKLLELADRGYKGKC